MVRIWPEFFAVFFPPTAGERLHDALAEIDDLRGECKILRFEREVMRHDRDFLAARLAEVEAGVAALQAALDDAEARLAVAKEIAAGNSSVDEPPADWNSFRGGKARA